MSAPIHRAWLFRNGQTWKQVEGYSKAEVQAAIDELAGKPVPIIWAQEP